MQQKTVIINSTYLILARDYDLYLDTKFNQNSSFSGRQTFFLVTFFCFFYEFF